MIYVNKRLHINEKAFKDSSFEEFLEYLSNIEGAFIGHDPKEIWKLICKANGESVSFSGECKEDKHQPDIQGVVWSKRKKKSNNKA